MLPQYMGISSKTVKWDFPASNPFALAPDPV